MRLNSLSEAKSQAKALRDALVGQRSAQWLEHLGEVPGQRFVVAAAEDHLIAVAKDDAAKPVPLRLEQHVAVGEARRRLGQLLGKQVCAVFHACAWWWWREVCGWGENFQHAG